MKTLPLAIQLYAVQPVFGADPRGTLRALAAMGFRGVEFAWEYGGLSPEELAGALRESGLSATAIYAPLEQCLDPDGDAQRYARAIDCPYLTTGLNNRVATDWAEAVRAFGEASAALRERGFHLLYHNHAEEFVPEGDSCPAAALLEADAEILFEWDTGWIERGGSAPLPWIERSAGRLPRLHVRDVAPDGKGFVPLGRGVSDLFALLPAVREAGAEWIVYEQDPVGDDLLEQARISAGHMLDNVGCGR